MIVTWLQYSFNTLEMALHTKTNGVQPKMISRKNIIICPKLTTTKNTQH
jgi:hypothetical protein